MTFLIFFNIFTFLHFYIFLHSFLHFLHFLNFFTFLHFFTFFTFLHFLHFLHFYNFYFFTFFTFLTFFYIFLHFFTFFTFLHFYICIYICIYIYIYVHVDVDVDVDVHIHIDIHIHIGHFWLKIVLFALTSAWESLLTWESQNGFDTWRSAPCVAGRESGTHPEDRARWATISKGAFQCMRNSTRKADVGGAEPSGRVWEGKEYWEVPWLQWCPGVSFFFWVHGSPYQSDPGREQQNWDQGWWAGHESYRSQKGRRMIYPREWTAPTNWCSDARLRGRTFAAGKIRPCRLHHSLFLRPTAPRGPTDSASTTTTAAASSKGVDRSDDLEGPIVSFTGFPPMSEIKKYVEDTVLPMLHPSALATTRGLQRRALRQASEIQGVKRRFRIGPREQVQTADVQHRAQGLVLEYKETTTLNICWRDGGQGPDAWLRPSWGVQNKVQCDLYKATWRWRRRCCRDVATVSFWESDLGCRDHARLWKVRADKHRTDIGPVHCLEMDRYTEASWTRQQASSEECWRVGMGPYFSPDGMQVGNQRDRGENQTKTAELKWARLERISPLSSGVFRSRCENMVGPERDQSVLWADQGTDCCTSDVLGSARRRPHICIILDGELTATQKLMQTCHDFTGATVRMLWVGRTTAEFAACEGYTWGPLVECSDSRLYWRRRERNTDNYTTAIVKLHSAGSSHLRPQSTLQTRTAMWTPDPMTSDAFMWLGMYFDLNDDDDADHQHRPVPDLIAITDGHSVVDLLEATFFKTRANSKRRTELLRHRSFGCRGACSHERNPVAVVDDLQWSNCMGWAPAPRTVWPSLRPLVFREERAIQKAVLRHKVDRWRQVTSLRCDTGQSLQCILETHSIGQHPQRASDPHRCCRLQTLVARSRQWRETWSWPPSCSMEKAEGCGQTWPLLEPWSSWI